MAAGLPTFGAFRSGTLPGTSGSRIRLEKSGTALHSSMNPLFYLSMEKLLMTLVSTIAGGWWWCERCRKNHVESGPCPRDPNYVAPDPDEVKARLDAAVKHIRENENATRDLKKYITKIEVAVYTCECCLCGKWFESDNERSAYCGC